MRAVGRKMGRMLDESLSVSLILVSVSVEL
jgi:hypothetical protein